MNIKEKHIPYFEVMDSLEVNECPICYLISDRIEKYFDTLLYEQITDFGFRKEFSKNQGFCKFHSYKFLSYNDGLAVSLTHRDLIENAINEFSTKKIKLFRKLFKIENKKTCMVCKYQNKIEKHYISVLNDYLDDLELKNKFLSSEGLCIFHYRILFKMNSNLPDWFRQFHINKYKELLRQIDKYIDSCNCTLGDKRPELNNNEKTIWKTAVKILFGKEEKNW